jgi:hypothetical protein
MLVVLVLAVALVLVAVAVVEQALSVATEQTVFVVLVAQD